MPQEKKVWDPENGVVKIIDKSRHSSSIVESKA
jgi:hypothetical protein